MHIDSSNTSILFSSLLAILVLTGAAVAIAQDASPDPDLYWVESQEGVWRVEPGEEPVQLIDLPENSSISGIEVSTDSEQLYWLHYGDHPPHDLETIRRSERDGSGQVIVVDYAGSGMNTVSDPRVDGDWVYWKMKLADHRLWFMRARRDGTGEVELIETEAPWQIIDFAIDAAGGHIYWTADRNDEPDYAIRRAALDGSDNETLLVRDGQMQSIALDREAEHIYWREETRLMRADFDGSNVLEVLTTTTTERGLALDLAADRIYWRDSGALIRRANLDGSGIEPFYQLPVGANWFAILPPKVTSTAQEPVSGVTLEQSYPNPATGTATIRFELDDPGQVRLELFDVLGRHIATLAEGPHVHGSHEVVIETGSLAPGTYVYRLSIDGKTAQRSLSIVGR